MSQPITIPSCQTRHAIILAAGESKRTRPLTSHRPKPLIPLLGKPLLAHIFDELVGLIEQVTLVVGYRAADIEQHFGYSYRGMELRYVRQHEMNGTASALLAVAAAGAAPDEPFFLLYGDNLISRVDLVNICRWRYSLAALRVEDPRAFGVLEIVDGKVVGILEKPEDPPPDALANPGIYHFDGAVFPALQHIRPSPRGEYELTDLIAVLAKEHEVGYSVCAEHWIPVGTPWEALNAAAFLLARRAQQPASVDPAAAIASNCTISGSVQIGRARIGAGCHIVGPVVIGDGCEIGAGCIIERSALEAGVSIGDGCVIEQSALGGGVILGSGCVVQHSLLDLEAYLGAGARLVKRRFAEAQLTSHMAGLLDQATLQLRGAILGPGVVVSPGTQIEPGRVLEL